MGQDIKMSFARTFEGKDANSLPEWKAQFVRGDTGVAGAFKTAAARGELKSSGGFVVMNLAQIETRIEQLTAAGGHEATIAQLQLGQHALEERKSGHAPASPTGKLHARVVV
jgi:hypothetical protein